MIEAWGRGVEKIFVECSTAGVPQPVFRYEHTGLWVEFGFRSLEMSTQKTTQKNAMRILAILKDNPEASRKEISETLKDITEDGVKYHLERLKLENRIRRIGPPKGGKWEVLDN